MRREFPRKDFPRRCFLIAILLLALPFFLPAGGSQEESGDRGKYMAEQGNILPADEVRIDSYISQINYRYPDPAGDLGVTLYTGHRQVSVHGQEEIVQIGLQGRREKFEDLPPLNLAFVFDRSGSMSGKHKMEWVKEAFGIFIERLRPRDTVSVVAFAEKADVLLPASRLDLVHSRRELIERVRAVKAEGESSLEAGLLAGYAQVSVNAKKGSVNRVLLVSDGLGEPEGLLDVVDKYKREGIGVSTIGVGEDFNFDIMAKIATQSGGSSRFMANLKKMGDIFDTDLDRMVVPVAYDLRMEIEFLQDVRIRDTWGYDHDIQGRKIRYFLPTLHHRDYETILIWMTIPSGQSPGTKDFARFSLTFRDREGREQSSGPHIVELKYADSAVSRSGYSNPMVLKAGTMLHIAQGLKDIGTLYYSAQEDSQNVYTLYSRIWQNTGVEQETRYDEVAMRESKELEESLKARRQRCLDLSVALRGEIRNAHLRLQEEIFKDELSIFEMYIKKLARELGLTNEVTARLLEEAEIAPPNAGASASIINQISGLVDELTLELRTGEPGRIVYGGFVQKESGSSALKTSALKSLVDDTMRTGLRRIQALSVVPDGKLESFLKERELSLMDLMDTAVALKAAAALGADYMITGSVIEMPSTVILFARVVNAGTGTVDSVAQLILPMDDQLRALLSR